MNEILKLNPVSHLVDEVLGNNYQTFKNTLN